MRDKATTSWDSRGMPRATADGTRTAYDGMTRARRREMRRGGKRRARANVGCAKNRGRERTRNDGESARGRALESFGEPSGDGA